MMPLGGWFVRTARPSDAIVARLGNCEASVPPLLLNGLGRCSGIGCSNPLPFERLLALQ